jgi:hypothetical protein
MTCLSRPPSVGRHSRKRDSTHQRSTVDTLIAANAEVMLHSAAARDGSVLVH